MGAAGSTAAGLTDQERKRASRRFERLTGKNGSMSMAEFIQEAGLKDSVMMRKILIDFDKSKGGSISQKDFASAMERIHGLQSHEGKANMLFHLYDADKDGQISADELTELWSQTPGGEGLSAAALQETAKCVLKAFDSNGDGRLSQQEFMSLLEHAEGRISTRR